MKKTLYIFAIAAVAFACENDDDSQAGNTGGNNNPNTMDSVVTYKVTFNAIWSNTSHPTPLPSGAHFSPIVGLTHNSMGSIYTDGALASPGIKNMAETGNVFPLDNEIDALIANNYAGVRIVGSGIGTPASTSENFVATTKYSQVSMVTMIAPSPDWFIAVKNVNLIENGQWVSSKTVDAMAYDAGTDSGMGFQSANSVTNPPENVHMITTAPLADISGKVATMGTFTFERIN